LQPKAFTSADADKLMDKAARAYVNHPRGSQVVDEELTVSSIYIWYQEDFGGSDAGVIRHLRQYARPDLDSTLAKVDEIADDHYDWTLNAVR
jgi:hypothetical protein